MKLNKRIIKVNSGQRKHPKTRSLEQIQKQIRAYKDTLTPDLTVDEIVEKLDDLESYSPLGVRTLTEGASIFRARTLEKDSFEELANWKSGDFWEVPENFVRSYGRLNHPHESVFYGSSKFKQTLDEIRYEGMVPVVVSRYEVKKPLVGIDIGYASYDDIDTELTPEEKIGGIMFANFFSDEFSKPVGRGTEYLYKESVAIADNFFKVPYQKSQAWIYPAVNRTPGVWNIAFKNHVAKDFLNYVGSVVFKGYSENGELDLAYIFDNNYIAHYPQDYRKWVAEKFDIHF